MFTSYESFNYFSLTSTCNFFCIILPFSLEPPALGIIFKTDNPEVSAKPVQFTKVAHIVGKGFDEVFFWYPIAPPGYASLGCMVSRTDEAPSIDTLCCPRMDLVNQANILEAPISRSSSSKASQCWSIWKVENQVNMFTWLFGFEFISLWLWFPNWHVVRNTFRLLPPFPYFKCFLPIFSSDICLFSLNLTSSLIHLREGYKTC